MKYGTWKVAQPEAGAVNSLVGAGYAPLTAMVLAARGMDSPRSAQKYLSADCDLPDPFLMTDMDKAARRVAQAMERGERMAVYGDYDVDGITASCLLTDFLRQAGADCLIYIPGRMEEGYGLNPMAITYLLSQGVKLIVTVDCGITAVKEARMCKELGIDLVITDHHECKEQLPDAIAVVDPHRPDGGYPHKNLSGVGVAFKLASALCGSQEEVLARYADMVCMGTVADVMLLQGENRVFVTRGLEALRNTTRPGLRSLMAEAGCEPSTLTSTTIGFILAPRINAAGRMGQIEIAIDLFLTRDPESGAEDARRLCALNRERQAVETDIYREAVSMLPSGKTPEAIVLASPQWHQGVVGIVASRMAEEYCCPTFLICLDGDKGKASSRSYGGFNLFASLTALSPLLESYGGHELAAGFTITRQRIDDFRREICLMAGQAAQSMGPRTILDVDCSISPELLTTNNVEGLDVLEPCGAGCPRPVFLLEGLTIERLIPVGGGRHLRLRLRKGRTAINAISFSTTAESLDIREGDLVDLACTLQINEYRGVRSVQVNLQDVRPSCSCPCSSDPTDYQLLRAGSLPRESAGRIMPSRQNFGDVWRFLAAMGPEILAEPVCLCRKIVRATARPLSLSQLLTCMDVFREAGLLEMERHHRDLRIRLTAGTGKADLEASRTMRLLRKLQEGK